MKNFKRGLVAMVMMSLLGCKVELSNLENDTDEDQVLFVARNMSAEVETIDKNDLYDFELKGEQHTLNLKGNLRQVFIIGSYNDVTISEDTYIERLVIEGDNNILTFSQCKQLTDLGEGNQIAFLQDSDCEISDEILTNDE